MTNPSQHYVKKHVDDQDITFQYGLALGDFTGGELTCWAEDGSTQTLDYTRKVLKMDGRLPHEVCEFSGERYCVIFYKLFDRTMQSNIWNWILSSTWVVSIRLATTIRVRYSSQHARTSAESWVIWIYVNSRIQFIVWILVTLVSARFTIQIACREYVDFQASWFFSTADADTNRVCFWGILKS